MNSQPVPRSLLIVEDNQAQVKTLNAILQDINIKPVTCTTAAEALKVCEDQDFEVALIDLRLPDMDGLDLLEEIQKKQPDTKVIILTGYGTLASASRAFKHNVLAYLEKTGDVEELLNQIYRAKASFDQEHLRNQLAMRTRELEQEIKQREKAETEKRVLQKRIQRISKMEALALMAGGVAHDLNNILSPVVGYPELLMLDIQPDHPSYKPLKYIHDAGQRASAVVNDLLTISRGGKIALHPIELNNHIKLFAKNAESLEMQDDYPDIHVEMQLGDDLPNIRVTETMCTSICSNLLHNAAEAMHFAGTITVITELIQLDEIYDGYERVDPGTYVRLQVVDQGTGLNANDMEHLFEPFYSRKKLGRSGTGLGLTVVWNSMRSLNGFVDLESTPQGTTFSLYFPVETKTKEAEEINISDTQPCPMGEGERILVVDDDPQLLELARRFLARNGYSSDTVSSGEEAVDFISRQAVDLVMLDMIMDPGINGLETYRRMIAVRPEQKTLIVSGYAENEAVRQTIKLGASGFLKKPYNLNLLGRAIAQALGKTK